MAYRNPRYMFAHGARDAGASSISVSDETAAQPATRLSDGHNRRKFKFGTAATNHTIAVDLGSGFTTGYDRLVIPAGHTLGGASYVVEQDDSDTFTSATTLASGTFAAGTDLIALTLTATSERYVRLRITTSGRWEVGEFFLTIVRTTTRGPVPGWVDQPTVNVNVTTMRSGEEYAAQLGEQRRELVYTYRILAAADLELFEDLLAATTDGVEPFYVDRTNDSLPPLCVKLSAPPRVVQDNRNPRATGESYSVTVSMREHIA